MTMSPSRPCSLAETQRVNAAAGKDGLAALAAINNPSPAARAPPQPKRHAGGRYELTEEAGYKHTGFAFPTWKKWGILTTIFVSLLRLESVLVMG